MKGSSNAVEGIIVSRNRAVVYKACAVSTWAICTWGLDVMFTASPHNVSLLKIVYWGLLLQYSNLQINMPLW